MCTLWFSSYHQGMGVLKALPQYRHPASCPAKGSSTGGGVGFQISLPSWVLQNEVFYGGQSANPPTNLLIKSNPTAGRRPQTQLGTRYGWPLSHKELLRPLTGFVFNPAWCLYPHTLLTRKPGGGDGLVADNPTMKQVSAGLHGTCSKSQM